MEWPPDLVMSCWIPVGRCRILWANFELGPLDPEVYYLAPHVATSENHLRHYALAIILPLLIWAELRATPR